MIIHQMAQRVIESASAIGIRIGLAESCTGGYVSKVLTDIPGASETFMFSIVAYSNDAKMRFLDVKESTLMRYGAVSPGVAREMALGVVKYTDIAVGITGIAGPGGGSEEKPVGLVWFGLAVKKDGNTAVFTERKRFSGDRNTVRTQAVKNALLLLMKGIEIYKRM